MVLMSSSYALAAPTCGPHMPQRNSIDAGLEFNVIRNYKTKDAAQAKLKGEGAFLCISYAVADWLVVDLKFGASTIRRDIFGGIKYDYDAQWGGGYGFRWQLYEHRDWQLRLIAGLHHLSIHPKANKDDTKRSAILDDSQAQLIVAKQWGNFDTYVGAKSSIARYIRHFNTTSETVSMNEHVSVVAGTDYAINERWRLNIEGRFLEEDAWTVGVRYQF